MRPINFLIAIAVLPAVLVSFTESAVAAPGGKHQNPNLLNKSTARMFGKDAPFALEDLPQHKHLRKTLESLPDTVRKRAMRKLHRFTFPEADLDSLQVDEEGGVFYSDENKPAPASVGKAAAGSVPSTPPLVEVLKLHSRPDSANKVYLDFDGHLITNTAWNSSKPTLIAVPYDIDGNPNSFNNEELNGIHEIWHRIAEDFSPFDIDVTTEEPDTLGPTVGRVVFTKNTDAAGLAMPYNTSGGIAYIDVFGQKKYASYYSPALVYYDNLFSNVRYMAESGSHEFGHNLGLSHDGTSTDTYYTGLGSGNSSWAPIMGSSFYANVTEWSKGEYPDANNQQDDIAIIANKLGFKADDHGDAQAAASFLAVEPDGSIVVTTPQDDPNDVDTFNKGIIEKRGDIDMFAFDIGAGSVNLNITPAWAAFGQDPVGRGANLDIKATLYDNAGNMVANSDPLDDTKASISIALASGRYYLAVTGVGNSVTPYSNYASEGEFFISGHVPPAPLADTTPPSPNPSWLTAPLAQSVSTIAMAATPATDASGVVEYRFICVAGGPGCVDSAWQTSPVYLIGGLAPATNYTFKVVARDAYGNQTPASVSASATTQNGAATTTPNPGGTGTVGNAPNTAPQANADTAVARVRRTVSLNVLANDTDTDGDKLTIVSVSKGSIVNGNNIAYKATLPGQDNITYTISDGKGGTASATVNITVTW